MNTRSTNHARAGLGLGLAALLLFAFASAALASGPPRVSVAATASQNLSVPVGKSIIVESADAVRRLSVAQPEIADTVILTPRQIYVTGKAAGVTTLTLWGEGNRVSAAFDVEVVPDVAALKEKIHQMFPNEEGVRAVATHDSITLSGTVSGAGNLAQISKLAEAYAPVELVRPPYDGIEWARGVAEMADVIARDRERWRYNSGLHCRISLLQSAKGSADTASRR